MDGTGMVWTTAPARGDLQNTHGNGVAGQAGAVADADDGEVADAELGLGGGRPGGQQGDQGHGRQARGAKRHRRLPWWCAADGAGAGTWGRRPARGRTWERPTL